jgi:hypothetical protein
MRACGPAPGAASSPRPSPRSRAPGSPGRRWGRSGRAAWLGEAKDGRQRPRTGRQPGGARKVSRGARRAMRCGVGHGKVSAGGGFRTRSSKKGRSAARARPVDGGAFLRHAATFRHDATSWTRRPLPSAHRHLARSGRRPAPSSGRTGARLGVGFALMLVNRISGWSFRPRPSTSSTRWRGTPGASFSFRWRWPSRVATLLQGTSAFALSRVVSVAAQRAIADMRRRVQDHVIHLPVSYFDTTRSGVLISRIMTDAEGIRNLVGTGIVQLVGGLLTSASWRWPCSSG